MADQRGEADIFQWASTSRRLFDHSSATILRGGHVAKNTELKALFQRGSWLGTTSLGFMRRGTKARSRLAVPRLRKRSWCPLWVISRHREPLGQCPLYPRKRTL